MIINSWVTITDVVSTRMEEKESSTSMLYRSPCNFQCWRCLQARFQQKQLEEKEHKLFAMLEEHHDNIPLNPATRTHSNSSSGSHHNSASSTASLASSLGSSMASSIGSTGNGGKVLFRRFLIFNYIHFFLNEY